MTDGIYNAKIEEVDITYDYRGFHQVMIWVKHAQGNQAFCGVLMNPANVGTVVTRVMEVVGSDSFVGLKGEYCRVRIEDRYIKGIGHWYQDAWYSHDELTEISVIATNSDEHTQ